MATYTLDISPNQWSNIMTAEGVYYAEVPLAEARHGMEIKSASVIVSLTDPVNVSADMSTLTIVKVKALDGELIFFAKIRPTNIATVKVELDKPKSKILLA
jgi:hypothetical protein